MTFFNGYYRPKRGKRNGMATSEIGAKKKERIQWESFYAKQFEDLMDLHRINYIHIKRADRENASFPDYALFGKGWLAFAEIKARNPISKVAGRLDVGQQVFHEIIKTAGGEVVTLLFPDDELIAQAWLSSKTGVKVSSWGLKLPALDGESSIYETGNKA